MGISSMLPTTGYIKMIDIWMIFTMAYPFLIISLHCIKEVCWNFTCVNKIISSITYVYRVLKIYSGAHR